MFCTAVGIEFAVIYGASIGVIFCELYAGFNRASEFAAGSQTFSPDAVGFHFEFGVAEGEAIRAEGFILLCVARIYRNEGVPLEFIDNEIIKFTFVVSGIGQKNGAFAGTVDTFKFFDEFVRGGRIFDIVGKCKFYKRDAFFRDDNMSTVTPEEDEVIFFAGDSLIRVVSESG